MLDLQVLCISKVIDLEELLYLFHTILCQTDHFIFFIDNEVSVFFLFNSHDRIHLGIFRNIIATLHLSGKNITCFIQFCGLAALTGNDKRCSRFIDQYGVNLIDDGVMQTTLNQLLFVDNHVIS